MTTLPMPMRLGGCISAYVNNRGRGRGRGRRKLLRVEARQRLLCISNGHGEDEVAASILKEIISMGKPKLEVEALPLVGLGHAYKRFGIATIGSPRNMPSGGFFFLNKLRLMQDIHAGLFSLTVLQWKTIQAWVMNNPDGTLLAVGDVFPLLLAWMASRKPRKICKGDAGSGIKFMFVGAAKSEYYIRDDDNLTHKLGFFDCLVSNFFSRSVYFPWERAMMSDSNCCLVVPRDSITAVTLKKALPAYAEAKVKDLGNPMMDNLKPSGALAFLKKQMPSLCVALLPGSRAPEVYFNWKTILDSVENLLMTAISDQITFLVPVFASLEMGLFSKTLLSMGWKFTASESILHDIEDSVLCVENSFTTSRSPDGKSDILHSFSYKKDTAFLLLTRGLFPDVASLADAAIAMAGTATEQFVGLGKPVFTLPGKGPQFTNQFANAQTRLLGKSVIMCSTCSIGGQMTNILRDERNMDLVKENGQTRMGALGASRRIAHQIHHLIWHKDGR